MIHNHRRLPAAALFGLFMLSAVVTFQLTNGSVHVPVPAKKPALTMGQPEFANFMDFSKALPFLTKSNGGAYNVASYARKPVPTGDAGLYKEIFTLQTTGEMKAASERIARLQDRRLMGHVLYQRYTHPAYKSGFDELKAWMDLYAAEPGADRIYKLALTRMPKGYKGGLKKPVEMASLGSGYDTLAMSGKTYKSPRSRSAAQKSAVQKAKNAIVSHVMGGRMDTALQRLQTEAVTFDTVEYDQLRATIASAYMYRGNITKAYETALPAVHRSNTRAPLAGWVAGMTAWQNQRYAEAAKFFEVTGRSQYSSGWMASAGAYWAARSHMKLGDVRQVSHWLDKAAEHPRTFYGLIATRALGRDFDFNWHVPTFTKRYYDSLMATPEGARAIALVAAGQPHRAENELFQLSARDADMRDAALAYAGYADLPALAMRLGNALSGKSGKIYDAALYPRTSWEPGEGYKIDPALINAIARQESRFDPTAESSSGALGLMQLMPATASSISRDLKVSAHEKKYRLKDPQINLDIGQTYIQTLLEDRNVKGDILKLLVAYNAGPGNLSRWQKQWDEVNDPLLFIELIPSAQTRAYVERVLANYWIYRLRENLSTPTLEALAAGKPALYAADYDRPQVAFRLASR